MIPYAIRFTKRAEDEAVALDATILSRIRMAIETKLIVDPERFSKPLRYTLRGLRVLRVGDWRVIFKIETHTVVILSVRNRKEGYGNIGA